MEKKIYEPLRVLILVDEEIENDKRVLSVIASYDRPKIINCKKDVNLLNSRLGYYRILLNIISALGRLFKIFFKSFDIWVKSFVFCNQYNKKLFAGTAVSFRSYIKALNNASLIMQNLEDIDLIYCNDLFCGIVAHKISKNFNINFIYDAHEVEFNRNRKNSWLRSVLDIIFEKEIILNAEKVFVVNSKIAQIYKIIYKSCKDKIFIKSNNHFNILNIDVHVKNSGSSSLSPIIIYIGGGIYGRKLETLAIESKKYLVPVYGFFIYEIPKLAIEYNWFIGNKCYENDLIDLVASRRCIMWCCLDDVCLSYNLSLPNKFFQAIAVGIPVIVSSDTYLAEIVDKYQLGFIYNQKNFQEFLDAFNSDLFCKWVANVDGFRLDYSTGKIIL